MTEQMFTDEIKNNIILDIKYKFKATIKDNIICWKYNTNILSTMNADYIYSNICNSVFQKNRELYDIYKDNKNIIYDIITKFITEKETKLKADIENEQTNTVNATSVIIQKLNDLFTIDKDGFIMLKNSLANTNFSVNNAADAILYTIESTSAETYKNFTIDRIRRTISMYIKIYIEEQKDNCLNKIKFIKYNDKFVTKWIQVLFDFYNIEKSELNIVMFKQLLYSIKRAVLGLTPPDIRLMYTFYSRTQGCGKTRFVAHLCDPFSMLFTDQATLDELVKINDLKALTNEYRIIDIQELASEKELDKSSFAALKKTITSDTVAGRALYTSSSERMKMMSLFLSSTNFHIADIIRDETGMRRFYSFDFCNKIADMNWEKIDHHWSFISEVYSYINENDKAFITDKDDIFMQLQEAQIGYCRRKDFITEWENVTGNKILSKKELGSVAISKIDLFKRLAVFCKTYEGFNLKLNTMRNILISRRDIYSICDDHKNEVYYCIINDKDTVYAQADKTACTTLNTDSNNNFTIEDLV